MRLFILGAVAAAGCVDEPAGDTGTTPGASAFLPEQPAPARDCGEAGRLTGSLYGAVSGELDWRNDTMSCEGMPRPDGEGARLRFAGRAGDAAVAFIVAIPDLEYGQADHELPSRVTVIEEGNGRFFSSAEFDSCWTDVSDQAPLDDDKFRVAGRLYCIAPLVEVNGSSSITITELEFSGLIDWDAG